MISLVTKLYDWLQRHRTMRISSLVVLSALLVLLILNQNYREDISDFLPLNNKYQKALEVYQNMSGADRILTIFQCEDTTKVDPDLITEAIDIYMEHLEAQVDSAVKDGVMAQVDIEKYSEVADFAYQHIPYFLTDDDYQRIDSLLDDESYVQKQIANAKQMLMFPASGMLSENIQRDPLNIFTPVVSLLQPSGTAVNYELYDGYIFSPDLKRALVTISSPHGASETEKNAEFVSLLESIGYETEKACPGVQIRHIGGPVIAVSNSKQIKYDSVISVILAVVLIVALLFGVFRNVRNILLIVLSISWGWLFAMGLLALLHDNVSVIVIGISSVILGIAVNYPLHLIAHLGHTPNVKSALKEIVTPLVVGNITTVGAFLALVPLKSVALRDLGLFSSFLLIGTIVFVLTYLPHFVRTRHLSGESHIFARIGDISFENKRWFVWGIVLLTMIFGYFSFDTSFDANISHINYMTDTQKEDLASLQKMLSQEPAAEKVYVVSSDTTIDGALSLNEKLIPHMRKMQAEGLVSTVSSCYRFLPSVEVQRQRLAAWDDFVEKYAEKMMQSTKRHAADEGFAPDTFDDFFDILQQSYSPLAPQDFSPLYTTALAQSFIVDYDKKQYHIVNTLATDKQHMKSVEAVFDNLSGSQYAFDVASMNSSIATSISDDFNYIGWACGLIVFLFLWFSLGNIELAMLSFLPMALSWVWILGIMALFHIQFNVVNVILATFIFGQGDDYTIFMTEGCQYEYAYRKKMLASYKSSIIISALIMFIGIGTLIIARHPALHSLAEVTIVGMFSVVLMAYVFPPLIYKWMVSDENGYRIRPFALKPFLVTVYCGAIFLVQLAVNYVIGFVLFVLMKPTPKSKRFLHRHTQKSFWFDMHHIANVKFTLRNPGGETFEQPAIIVCNHQSMLDTALLMALSPKIVIVANENASQNWVIKPMFKWLDNYSIREGEEIDEDRISSLIKAGYSVVIFPEGKRNPHSSILRFHKGAFYLAERIGVDIVPLLIHGANHVFPRNTYCTYPGDITVSVGQRIKAGDASWGTSYEERTKRIHRYYVDEFERLRQEKETAAYFQHFVRDRYRYKGLDIYSTIKKRMRQHDMYAAWLDTSAQRSSGCSVVVNSRHGEFPLLLALTHPQQTVYVVEPDEDLHRIAKYSAKEVAGNLVPYLGKLEEAIPDLPSAWQLYLVEPTLEDEKKYQMYNPIVIK